MSKYTDAFDTICGNCAGLNIADISADDVRTQAAIYDDVDQEDIEDAVRGLEEYQRTE